MVHSHSVQTHRRQHTHRQWPAIVLLAALLAAIASLLIPAIGRVLDDIDFGYPRTTHLSAAVGHEDQPGRPTHFIAVNLDREPVIWEIPGGDPDKARILKLPRIVGAAGDLVPVRMTLELVNTDQSPDLVISIQGEEFIYINEAGNYRLINDAERAELEGR